MTYAERYRVVQKSMQKKKIPTFKSDRAAADFVDKADLSQYDLSGAKLTRIDIRIQHDLAAGRLDSAIKRALDDEKNGCTRLLQTRN